MLTVILGVGGCLLIFGANFGLHMVKTQFNAQAISFPAKGSAALSPAEFPDLQRYAGQKVDTGPKAKAYADGFHPAAPLEGRRRQDVFAGECGVDREAERRGTHR